ncbi:MAG TPA: helix-turn-helix domain-containing protein [Thermomicrobiales bacterium]|nr:helix-turn-helix domain-containing protein [Thermomicrobiales bacterium]
MGVFGDTLRQARAHKGVTLKEAEQATRINRHHLAALEDEHFANLPPLIYQRGIVRNYAAYLDLDPGKLLAMFEEARGGESPVDLVAAVKPLEMPSHWAPNFAIIAFMVVMSAIIFAWVYSISFNTPAVTATLPPAIPTVTPIPDDRLALPSPTPFPTATATPRAIATSTPLPTATPAPTVPPPPPTQVAVNANQGQAAAQQPAAQSAPQQAPTGAAATIRVLAQSDIQVTITADGNVVFSGWLGSGNATDWYTASHFSVTTSDGSATLFENANTGQQFYMGYGQNETYYLSG